MSTTQAESTFTTEMVWPRDIMTITSPAPRPGPIRRFWWWLFFDVRFKKIDDSDQG